MDVVFDINEGKKANIIKIDFVGNEHISAKDLRQVMKTKEKGWLTWITKSGRIDREQVEDDLAELVTYYRNKGCGRSSGLTGVLLMSVRVAASSGDDSSAMCSMRQRISVFGMEQLTAYMDMWSPL